MWALSEQNLAGLFCRRDVVLDRIKKSFLKFRWELNLKIDATEEGIKKAIDKAMELKKASAVEVEKATTLIAAQHRQLELIKEELEALDGTILKL